MQMIAAVAAGALLASHYHSIATRWSADYHRKAEVIQMTDDSVLDEKLHVALDNAYPQR